MKKLILYFLLLSGIISVPGWGQTTGDYRSFQSGNWNVAGNWQKYNGSAWVAASEFPSVTALTRIVTIQSGHTIVATSDITTSSLNASATIIVAANGTLNMGTYGIRGSSASTKFKTVTINGNLNTTSFISADNFAVGAAGIFVTSYVGTSGWWYGSASPSTVTINGTVEFNGAINQVIPGYSYSRIIVSGTDPKTMPGAVNVTGILTVNLNASLVVNEILAVDGSISLHGVLRAGPVSNITVTTLNIYTTNGLILQSDINSVASLIISGTLNSDPLATGNSQIELFQTGGGTSGSYRWHYISSPLSYLSVNAFTGTTLNLAQYIESRITNNYDYGWVNFAGFRYYPEWAYGGPTFDHLDVGAGYYLYFSSDHTYTFSGTLNTADINVNLAYNSGAGTEYPNSQGFNLIGNPFSSSLDWEQINVGLDPSISQAIYFNKNDGNPSWINGVGTNGATSNILPMQGFLVKTYAAGKSITLPASARVHSSIQPRFKSADIIPLVRLMIEDQANSDDAIVRFDNLATTSVDKAFDAYKLSKRGGAVGTGSIVNIWTILNGVDFSINGLPFPETSVEIPVAFNSSVAANIKISGSQIEGLENYNVTLTDKVNNITIDLKTTPNLSFNAPVGIVTDRFVLKVSKIITAVQETKRSDKAFNIYSTSGLINIQAIGEDWNGKAGDIKILDMTGRVISTENKVMFSKDEIRQIPARVADGIYLVEIKSGVMRYVGKVIIK